MIASMDICSCNGMLSIVCLIMEKHNGRLVSTFSGLLRIHKENACHGQGVFNLQDYCDTNMAGDLDTHNSTSGYVFRVNG